MTPDFKRVKAVVTREQAKDFSEAHSEGLHYDATREGCPDCEGRELRSYPTEFQVKQRKRRQEARAHPDPDGKGV